MTSASSVSAVRPARDATPEGFAAYEYSSVKAPRDLEPLYIDAYRNFGWEAERDGMKVGTDVTLRLRRPRINVSRRELGELERSTLRALESIAALQRSCVVMPLVVSGLIGLLGCALLFVSVMGMTTGGVTLAPMIIGIGGLMLWLIAYGVFVSLQRRRVRATAPEIDRLHDVVFDNGARAAALIHQP
ncbi:hypothetical protein [Actinomyces ruminicola]|uniref:hypothetical protein n=1 Tax=Actinomyces ruminicola TaxID=332524 RepID=UPI0011C7BDA7|nr:hypothetical protein [Actinomyces ruminicola]